MGNFSFPIQLSKFLFFSVSVMFGLVWAVHGYAYVISLLFSELGEFHAEFFEVETGDFFVKFLFETVNTRFFRVKHQVDLREGLVCK